MKTTSHLNKTRDDSMARYYAKGHSMRECSAEFGIGLSRVQQIFDQYYPAAIRARGDTSNHSTGLTSGQRVARRGR